MDKVLIDSSAWIEYLRDNPPFDEVVSLLIDQDKAASCGVILGELLQGVKKDREYVRFRNFPAIFEFPDEGLHLWIQAGELSAGLRRRGITVGLADCYIAVVAQENGYSILSADTHFAALSAEMGVKLYPL